MLQKSNFLDDVDIDNILISNMVSSGEKSNKYFIGYMDDDCKIKPFSIILPKFGALVEIYDAKTKWMYFFIGDDELLEKYNDIWNKVSNGMKK